MTFEEMKEKLKSTLSEKRYTHSINVMETAVKLAKLYGSDLEKAALAGLLHDCARCLNSEQTLEMCAKFSIPMDKILRSSPVLLHAALGAKMAREKYEVKDQEVLEAICSHTSGRTGMGLLEKIIFIADYIEPGRNECDNLELIRKTAFADIDEAMLISLDTIIKHIIDKGVLIHYSIIDTRNYIVESIKNKGR